MSTSYCSLIPRLFHRSAAFLAALLVTATLSAQPTTVPVISLNGPVTHPTGPVFRYQIATVPGTSPATSYTLVSGAPTFSLDPVTGLVTALVLFPGPASFSFTATNSAGTSPVTTITVAVSPPGPDSTANATVGVPFSFLALGPPGSLSYTATGLAAGLSLDSATGIISGTPTAAGTFRATLNAFNGGTQPSAQGSLTITVAAATAPAVPVISTVGKLTHTTGPVFGYQIELAPGSPAATSYALVSGGPTFSLNSTTGAVTALVLFPGPTSFSVTASNVAGTSATTTVNVTVNPPGPDSVTNATLGASFSYLLLGPPGSLSYTASGLAPGLALDSATGIISGTPSTAGTYRATVSAFNGGTQPFAQGSLTITVASAATVAPVVTSAASISGSVGALFTYPVTASGSPTSYRLRSGLSFLNFDVATATVSGTPTIAGTYTFGVTVTNAAGSTTAPVTLTVAPEVVVPLRAYLSNSSFRAAVGTGAQTLIAGYAISGSRSGTTGVKTILIRGIGPTLASYGVSRPLADPKIDVFPSGQPSSVFTNDDWDPSATTAAGQAAAGAFPLATGSKDAAFLGNNVQPGASTTFQIAGVGGATGVALAEFYDTTPAANFTATTTRFINVSGRAQVGTGEEVFVAGFNLRGPGTRRFLIRALGPTLGTFGVTGALADPKLDVFAAGSATAIASNDNWDAATTTPSDQMSAGAFALTGGSKDAVVIVNLSAGTYTALVTGVGGTTGVAMLEIYEMP